LEHLIIKYLLPTSLLIMLFLSCTPVGYFSSSPKKTSPAATGDDVMLLIEQGRFYEAEKELVPRIVSNPDDPLPKKQLVTRVFQDRELPVRREAYKVADAVGPGDILDGDGEF